MNNSSNCW